MPARSTLTSYNHGRRHNGHLILPHIHPRRDTELIFNPDGTDILTLPGIKRPKSPCQVECPSRPRMRHNPSLVDMDVDNPPSPVEDEDEDVIPIRRRNPCCLCKVGFFHGAMNFAFVSVGLHFFLMFYCIYIALFTKDYTYGFLQFWGIDLYWDVDSQDTKQLMTEVHVTGVVGGSVEMLGLVLTVILIYALISEVKVWCVIWCVLSSVIMGIELFGIVFLATRLSFMVVIPIPFFVLIQAFGLWVIVSYIQSIGDPKKCPICHHIIRPNPPEPSDYSLPTSLCHVCNSRTITVVRPPSTTGKSSATDLTDETTDDELYDNFDERFNNP